MRMKSKNSKSMILKFLLAIILFLYFAFLCIDIFGIKSLVSSNKIKFLSMILVLFICLIIGKNSISRRDAFLLKLGISITLIADILLLLLNIHYIWGIGLFCIVQILYFIRYSGSDPKIIIRNFSIIFITLFFIYTIVNLYIVKIDSLVLIAFYYAICLLSSTYRALSLYKNQKYSQVNIKMISVGMILFLLCDINVALYNIIGLVAISSKYINLLKNLSYVSMWLFYLPSQVLLSLSGYSGKYLNESFSNKSI